MKTLWLFSFCSLITTSILPMGFHVAAQPGREILSQKASEIADSVKNALRAFNIVDPTSIEVKTEIGTTHHDELPEWVCEPSKATITLGMVSHPHLLDFVSYCAAAEIKNNTLIKQVGGCLTNLVLQEIMGCVLLTRFALPYVPIPPEYKLWAEIPAILGGAILGAYTADKTSKGISDYFYKQAFSLACKKLVDQQKTETISAYLAYMSSKDTDHKPLSRDQKFAIIKNALQHAEYSFKIERDEKKNEAIASIFNPYGTKKIVSRINWLRADGNESCELETRIENPKMNTLV